MEYPYVNIHTHARTGNGIEMVSAMAGTGSLPAPPCSVGIHPWQAGLIDAEAALREVAEAAVNAIGEIGLDHARPADPGLQETLFEAQLRIAQERGLPVILHCVRTFEPMMEILAKYTLRAVIFHGFVGSRQQVDRATEAGYRLSFGVRSFASPKTVEAIKATPLSNLFLETDDGDAPIDAVYSRAADIPGVGVDRLKEVLYHNYIEIFRR